MMLRIAQQMGVVALTLAGLYLAWELRWVILLAVIAVALAAALQGPINLLRRLRIPYVIAVLTVVISTVAVIGGLLVGAGEPLLSEMELIGSQAGTLYSQLAASTPDHWFVRVVRDWFPAVGTVAMSESSGNAALNTAVGMTSEVVEAGAHLLLVAVLAFYWFFDRERFERLGLSLLSSENRAYVRETWHAIEREIGAYFRSEVVQSVLAGVLLWVGFRLMGHPHAATLGLLGALAWSVPWAGTCLTIGAVCVLTLIAIPFDPRGLTQWFALIPILYTALVLILLETVVEPRIFNRGRYNSLLLAIVSITLADLYGVWWMLLGPPLAVVIQIAADKVWNTDPVTMADETPATVAARIHRLQQEVKQTPNAPAELANLVDRLAELVDEQAPVVVQVETTGSKLNSTSTPDAAASLGPTEVALAVLPSLR